MTFVRDLPVATGTNGCMRMDIDNYTKPRRPGGARRHRLRRLPEPAARPRTLRCLRYMHDVEHHTVCYLRDLLVTPAHRDPDMTAFLTMWTFEEFWHGEAIGAVLAAHDEPAGPRGSPPLRAARRAGTTGSPRWCTALGSWLAGPSYTAVHMTWGAVNEWTHAGRLLAAGARGPATRCSTELLRRIMRQEGRHIDFYATQAERRLEGDRRAQRLDPLRAAPRSGGQSAPTSCRRAEVRFLVAPSLRRRGRADAAERIDRRIDRLPGLDGLHLIRGAAERYASTGA